MSYIGNGPPLLAQYGVESFNGGGTSFTLSKPATTATVLVFIDGVRQTPTDAYSVSGVTLTTTATTPSGTDNVTVQFLGDVVDFGEPSDDSVSTAKIQDDAVTAAKLANSINTEITANTAKVTNATHTGDVTGATALTIAADAVDIAMLSATGTADATTFLRGDNAWAAAGGDNTPSFRAYLSTNQTGTTNSAWNKVNLNTEDWDTDSAYDNSTNYRFTVPAGEGGKYSFSMAVGVAPSAGADAATDNCKAAFYVNGAKYTKGSGQVLWTVGGVGWDSYIVNTSVLNLSAADYVEAYVYHDMGTSRQLSAASSFFSGFKLVGV